MKYIISSLLLVASVLLLSRCEDSAREMQYQKERAKQLEKIQNAKAQLEAVSKTSQVDEHLSSDCEQLLVDYKYWYKASQEIDLKLKRNPNSEQLQKQLAVIESQLNSLSIEKAACSDNPVFVKHLNAIHLQME